jgi:uncharacterized LabA/DUF88 family protein
MGSGGVDKVAVFLDGGYIDKVLLRDFKGERLDYEKLSLKMAAPDELLRAYYYLCLPYVSATPTKEEHNRYAARRRFIAALEQLPRFEVRLGRLAYQGGQYVQKRVDCMVGVDMALLAAKAKIQRVALFTGDSDLMPAVEAVKREGVVVTLWHGFGEKTKPSRELFALCDERRMFTPDVFSEVKKSHGYS